MKNDFYVGIYESTYLSHHGIDGMKWGVQNGPPYPLDRQTHNRVVNKEHAKAKRNLSKAKTYNLDKWGKSKETNILYITGLSGSGKSTVANYFKSKGKTDVIHLDMYFNQMSSGTYNRYRNKAFNAYLDQYVKGWRQIPDLLAQDKSAKSPAWKLVDQFARASEMFGEQQYGKKRKVVMEGVEILGETMYVDISKYRGKPMIILTTGNLSSSIRGSIRDEIDPLTTLERMFGKQSKAWRKELKDLDRVMK